MEDPSARTGWSSRVDRAILGLGTVAVALGLVKIANPAWDLVSAIPWIFAVAAVLSIFSNRTKSFAFALWVIASVSIAVAYPGWFEVWLGRKCNDWVSPLIQIAMFGMGATLTAKDFVRVFKMPWAIAIGAVLQFAVMPLTGYLLTLVTSLPPEVAAGVILVGSCPGGVSSNVITYLAKGNVALSVTLTACTTLMSPIMTPLMMSLLAGRIVEVRFVEMMLSILLMVITPIAAGLIVNMILERYFAKSPKMESLLSIVSMIAICLICAIIAAGARSALANVGAVLICVVAAHNSIGYILGYWGARACRMNEADCRTVAIEVGLQNGGMAAALATKVLKSSEIALAAAIFAPWMNVTGSILASWWRRR